jgi:hypothetical protein
MTFDKKGNIYVADSFQFAQTVISQWAGQVKVHNIVRIPIPPFPK